MKKQRGFILTETLIVSAVVACTLVLLYSQFRKLNLSYSSSFTYNTSSDLFLLYNFKEFLIDENKVFNDITYIDLSTCPSIYINDTNYCNNLMDKSGIKTIIISEITCEKIKQDITNLTYSTSFKKYINKIDSAYNTGYRLLAEFNDGTFANIVIGV